MSDNLSYIVSLSFRMADFFLDEPVTAAAPPAATSDPAADFLAGEQADLAAIDGNVYDQVAGDEGGFEEVEPDSDNPIEEEHNQEQSQGG